MSRKLWVLPVLVAVLLALGSGASFAMPSLGGPTGLVSVPNALVAPRGELQVAVGYQKVTEGLVLSSGSAYGVDADLARKLKVAQAGGTGIEFNEDFSVWGLQVLSGVADGAELWAAYQHANSDIADKIWGIGGKFQFLREPKDQAYVAIFASYQKADGGSALLLSGGMYTEPELFDVNLSDKVTTVGLVATKDLTPTGVAGSEWSSGAKLFGSAGVMYKRSRSSLTVNGSEASGSDSLTRPFLGAEFVTTDGTELGLEYRWKDSDLDAKAVWSAVLRHNFPKGFAAELGTTNADPLGFGTNDQNFFVRVGYSFPVGKY